jgi:hypothetical protein
MNTLKKSIESIDRRPFQSKAELERRDQLAEQYRTVAIPEVAAALSQGKRQEETKAA